MTRRSLIAVLLSLMLSLTGQSMAVARGASAATGQMILCTGAGPLAIYVDATGKPTSAPHICPDAGLNIAFDGPVMLLDPPTRLIVFEGHITLSSIVEIPRRKERPDPRAPPPCIRLT